MAKSNLCPCGSKVEFNDCCYPFISGQSLPATPERLMRSRYSAYTLADIDYIIETMSGAAAEGYDREDALEWARSIKWLKLEVIRSAMMDSQSGIVEFNAYYRFQNKKHLLHEVSLFELIDNRWFYVAQISD